MHTLLSFYFFIMSLYFHEVITLKDMNLTKKIVVNLEKVGSDLEKNMRKIGSNMEEFTSLLIQFQFPRQI